MSQKGGRMIGRVVGRAACIGALGLAIGGCGAGTAFLGGSGGPFGFFQQMQNQIANESIGQRYGSYANLASRLLMTNDQVTKAKDLDRTLSKDLTSIRDGAQQQFLS